MNLCFLRMPGSCIRLTTSTCLCLGTPRCKLDGWRRGHRGMVNISSWGSEGFFQVAEISLTSRRNGSWGQAYLNTDQIFTGFSVFQGLCWCLYLRGACGNKNKCFKKNSQVKWGSQSRAFWPLYWWARGMGLEMQKFWSLGWSSAARVSRLAAPSHIRILCILPQCILIQRKLANSA